MAPWIAVALAVALGLALASTIHLLAAAALARLIGAPVSAISLGVGPALIDAPVGATRLRLAPLLISGHLRFDHRNGSGSWIETASWPAKTLVALAGPLAVIALAGIWLGEATIRQTIATWTLMAETVLGFPAPLDLVGALYPVIEQYGMMAVAALAMTRHAAFNLTPLPLLNGGDVVRFTLEALLGRQTPQPLYAQLAIASLLLLFGFFALFFIRLAL